MEQHLGGAVRREEPWLAGMKLDGMTDRLIVREAMLSVGHPFDEALCDRVLDSYAERLEVEIQGEGYEVLPGVEALLEALAAGSRLVGLCTGNIARGARIKLARGGLDRFFGFGEGDGVGFAGDGEARDRIVAAALRRAEARLPGAGGRHRPLRGGGAAVRGCRPRRGQPGAGPRRSPPARGLRAPATSPARVALFAPQV